MKNFHKRGGGGRVNRISYLLFRTVNVLRNTVKVLNKDFIKAVRGGGGHRFMKLFHKIPLFSGDGFPYSKQFLLILRFGCMDLNRSVERFSHGRGFNEKLSNAFQTKYTLLPFF